MTTELNVARLINVEVIMSPLAAARRGFGTLMLAGDSGVFDQRERFRVYTDIDGVADDFSPTDPEYLAAALYFGQSPKPRQLMIGAMFDAAQPGMLKGGAFTAAAQAALVTALELISDGEFTITIDGAETATDLDDLDFDGITTLAGAAAIIDTALGEDGECAWDGERFVITSATTGTASSVSFATVTGGDGTDIASTLKLTAATALYSVDGIAAETPVESVQELADMSGAWYGLALAVSSALSDAEILAVAAFIEAASPARILGVTETDTNTLNAVYTTDIAYQLEALGYRRSITAYSQNANAICSAIGRAFSVNFNANRATITLMYKQLPGIAAENLTETQAQALAAKMCNVYAAYNNDTAIFQTGQMADGSYFDEVHGLDWFADALQNALYNLLYTSTTKIPQTEAGANQLVAEAAKVCQEAINNGLVAPGTWNADGFGQLERGQYLPDGYYIYMQPMSEQAQALREQRVAPVMQIALKLAGAVHTVDVQVNVNR
ncbi:MAG: DUF3383 domain-containing protein [Deltaproteobacteria bacterium]|nr:DUF3383 domain-containing protein [Deltaproteobacteria bacterium]